MLGACIGVCFAGMADLRKGERFDWRHRFREKDGGDTVGTAKSAFVKMKI